jgi:endonuclease/exonuclease/phosphatase family metal-dependent hydrolase
LRKRATRAALVVAAALAWSCAQARNYTDPAGPRYAGSYLPAAAAPRTGPLKVVTFNIRYAIHVDRAIVLFREREPLRDPDVVALQEMDAAGADLMARALGDAYVYYPGAFHPTGGKDFGNAVLARGPIEDDRKIILPHLSRFRQMQRIAVAATVVLRGERVRVYSLHLATQADLGSADRRDQIEAILRDARDWSGPAIVAGDFNDRDTVAKAFQAAGFEWVTRDIGPTVHVSSWDHIFARGLRLAAPGVAAAVTDNGGASDHLPAWAELLPAGRR